MTNGSEPLLTVDLANIAHNYRRLRQEAPSSEIAAVVKADSYGLDADKVSAALEKAGARLFFVARLDEGITLRNAHPQLQIAVLDGIAPRTASTLLAHKLIPVLNQPAELREWQALALLGSKPLPAVLHVETGINRLGFAEPDIRMLLNEPEAFAGIDLHFIMSHLACADEPGHPMNEMQRHTFEVLAKLFPGLARSLANSSGIFLGSGYQFDLCRPGVALFGGNPTPHRPNPMRPVVRLQAPVLQVSTIERDGAVGYGATYPLKKGRRIATVPVGYADGWLRSASNRGHALLDDIRLPYAGRISMDMLTLDVSSVPEDGIERGTMVELLGDRVDINEVAAWADTVPYEILTGLSARYQRRYLGLENVH